MAKGKGKKSKGKGKGKVPPTGGGAPAPVPRGGAPAPVPNSKCRGKKGKKGELRYPFRGGRNPELTAKMEAAAKLKETTKCEMCRVQGYAVQKQVPSPPVYGGLKEIEGASGPCWDYGLKCIKAENEAQVREFEKIHQSNIVWCCSQKCADEVPYVIEFRGRRAWN